MGFKTQLLAVGPDRPSIARATHPEGGPDQAAAALSRWLPGVAFVPIGTADVAQGGYPRAADQIWVSTFGPTTLFGGDLAENGLGARIGRTVTDGRTGSGRWELTIHSVVDLCQFRVEEPGGAVRELAVTSESTLQDVDASSSGAPLPFELPYWAGEHRLIEFDDDPEREQEPLPFHPLELGEAALAWIFGLAGEGAPEDDVQRALGPVEVVDDVPMHGFRLVPEDAPAPGAPRPEASTERSAGPAERARGPWWRRLFGR